ncbi:MAG: DUF58 domain-containing protein, partial [Candidatus Liptonbacteria bacterium]|nr:DUF58 domain-containing protein [Candidatus Liptonbacteria bacterium]
MTLYEETTLAIQKIQGGVPIAGLSSRLHFGEHRSKFKGEGCDLYQIREYDPDIDSIDRVIWHRAAEPGGELCVRESIQTKDVPLILLTDLSSSTDFGAETLPKRKLLLECVGILGLTAAHDQDLVGLLGFTDTIVLDEVPKGGANYVYHLLSELCGFLENVPEHERSKTDFIKSLAAVEQ